MEHFYIITNESKDPDLSVTHKVRDYLTLHGRRCTIQESKSRQNKEGYTDAETLAPDVDCVLVLGGDGTLLQAATDLAERGLPFLGINLGTLGFLAEVNQDDIEEALSKLLKGAYEVENRMMLSGTVYKGKEKKGKMNALNDIVVTGKDSLQLIHFSVSVNGQFLHRYHADGMIAATPTGSTGYSLSAGGPVVEPKARLLLLSPVCPHSMASRSMILSPEDEIVILIEAGRDGIRQEVEAIFDGSHRERLVTGDKIVIRKSERTTGIIKLSQVSFLEILHRKMCD